MVICLFLVAARYSFQYTKWLSGWLFDWLAALCPFRPVSCHGAAFVFIFDVVAFVFDSLVP